MRGYDGGCAALGDIKKKSRKSLLLQRPATIHKSDRRGSNPRSRPWQGRALPTTPLSHMMSFGFYLHRTFIVYMISNGLSTIFRNFLITFPKNFRLSLRAGDGNRTHVSSLEGWCSTIELHPHVSLQKIKPTAFYIIE